jgi:hypothetical protein
MSRARERARLAREADNAGDVLRRLVSFARLVDEEPPRTWSLDTLDDLAAAIGAWAVAMSPDPSDRSGLADQSEQPELSDRGDRERRA